MSTLHQPEDNEGQHPTSESNTPGANGNVQQAAITEAISQIIGRAVQTEKYINNESVKASVSGSVNPDNHVINIGVETINPTRNGSPYSTCKSNNQTMSRIIGPASQSKKRTKSKSINVSVIESVNSDNHVVNIGAKPINPTRNECQCSTFESNTQVVNANVLQEATIETMMQNIRRVVQPNNSIERKLLNVSVNSRNHVVNIGAVTVNPTRNDNSAPESNPPSPPERQSHLQSRYIHRETKSHRAIAAKPGDLQYSSYN